MKISVFTDMIVAKPVLLDSKEDGKTKVRFQATRANVINDNMRMYPGSVMSDAQQRANTLIKENRMIGESPHPRSYTGKNGKVVFDTKLENSVIKIYNQFMDDEGRVFVDAEILDTAKGKDLKALVDSGIPVGISMRALGDSVRKQVNGVMVDVATKLDIQSYDVVMNPATPGCEIVSVLTDSQVEEVMKQEPVKDDVQITLPSCPGCGGQLQAQDPDGDGDLDFYSCPVCQDVYMPDESFSTTQTASQSLRKLPNDPDWDGYSLAKQFQANLRGNGEGGMTDAKLSPKKRDGMGSQEFAVPGKRALPINDKNHVEMAWKMVDKTKGLTDAERKSAKSKIKAKAKKLGIDTSAWTDDIQEEDDQMTKEQILAAIKDSDEFKSLVAEQAKVIAQPALDAVENSKKAKEAAEALAKQKEEAKTFVDSKLKEIKGKIPEEFIGIVKENVKDVASKENAGVIIDSMISMYSKFNAQANLDNMGFDSTKQQTQGDVRVQVVDEKSPWSKQVSTMLDSFDRIGEEFGHIPDLSIRKVNMKFLGKVIKRFEEQVGNEVMKDSVAVVDSLMQDSVSVTTTQLLNQPTIQQAILIESFQDVESLQFMASETFEGSEVRWPAETFTSAATINPASGIADMLVGEGAGIPESNINLTWLTYNPLWRRNAISLTTDVVKTLQSGPAKYDAISRGLYHIAFDKRRKLDNLAYLEMIMASDEYAPNVIASETASGLGSAAGQVTAVSNGTNVVYKYLLTVGGTANATFGTNPVVRPRTKKQILPSGATQSVTSNPFTVTVSAAALTMGYLDANGNVQAGTYAVDFENGIVYFSAGAGIDGTHLPTFAYSAVTNYTRWSTTVPGSTVAEQYYNSLLQLVTQQVQLMGSSPRFNKPNLGIMSLNASQYIENASMWYKFNSPDLGGLTGGGTSNLFGSRSGVNLNRINAPWVAGDNRMLLTQKGATRYAIETPYQIEGPYPKYDGSGNIVDAKVYYGRENSVLATPQTIDINGNILNPKSRTIKLI